MNKKVISAATFIGITLGSIYAINKSISKFAEENSRLANSYGMKYNSRFGDIFYTKVGNENNKPILLIHDLSVDSSSVEWKEIISSLKKDHLVYSIDLLGCGRSEKPMLTYTNYMYVQLISEFIRNVICKRTDVVVTGDSSSFVLMSCFIDTNLYNKIVMVNPSSKTLQNEKISTRKKLNKFILEQPLFGTLAYNIIHSKNAIISLFNRKYFKSEIQSNKNIASYYYDAAHYNKENGKYLYASIISGFTGLNAKRAIQSINNSISIIYTDEEKVADTVSSMSELNPSIESAYIANSLHLPQLEKSEEFIEKLSIFLS